MDRICKVSNMCRCGGLMRAVNAVAKVMSAGVMLCEVSESARDRGRKGDKNRLMISLSDSGSTADDVQH
jgi:hypothetical protein